MTNRAFKAGDKVALIDSGWGHNSVRVTHVTKVYKNGRFILDFGTGQFRANGSGTGNWSQVHVEHWDDVKHPAMVIRARMNIGVHSMADYLRGLGGKISVKDYNAIGKILNGYKEVKVTHEKS